MEKQQNPAGRPRVAPVDESVIYRLRMSAAQREKLAALGGAAWVRAQIERIWRAGEMRKRTKRKDREAAHV